MGNSPTGTGGGTGDTNDGDEESDTEQTTVDDHVPPEENESTEGSNDSDDEVTTGAVVGGAAVGAATGGAAGVGAGGTGSGGAVGGGSVVPASEGTEKDPSTEDDTEDTNDSQDTSRESGDSDGAGESDNEMEDDDETEQENESDDEDGEDDEDEEENADFTIYTDPWDTTGWGNEPDLQRLQETFGDNLTVSYDILPPRPVNEWDNNHGMPSIQNLALPESTENSYQALKAAQEQDLFREYLRRLRIAAQVEGRNIEDKDLLIDLAEETGLDTEQLQRDIEKIDVAGPKPVEETPQMDVTISDIPHYWTENVEYGRAFGRMVGEGVKPVQTGRSIKEFVDEYGPVATTEVTETFQLSREEAIDKLHQSSAIYSIETGLKRFWKTGHN